MIPQLLSYYERRVKIALVTQQTICKSFKMNDILKQTQKAVCQNIKFLLCNISGSNPVFPANPPADDDLIHPNHVAGLRELGPEPDHLHHLQRRVQKGVQEDHGLLDNNDDES